MKLGKSKVSERHVNEERVAADLEASFLQSCRTRDADAHPFTHTHPFHAHTRCAKAVGPPAPHFSVRTHKLSEATSASRRACGLQGENSNSGGIESRQGRSVSSSGKEDDARLTSQVEPRYAANKKPILNQGHIHPNHYAFSLELQCNASPGARGVI